MVKLIEINRIDQRRYIMFQTVIQNSCTTMMNHHIVVTKTGFIIYPWQADEIIGLLMASRVRIPSVK